jgi:hypothetical protein
MDHDVEQYRTVEAEAQRLLIAAQKPRGRGRPPRGRSQLLQRALNLCEPFLPVALFNLLCTLTQKRPANLGESHLTKKQRKVLEVIIKSGARLTLGQVADRTRVSRQYVHHLLKKYHSYCMSEILTRRIDSNDLRYTSDDRPTDYSYLVQEIKRRGGTFPVRSPIDQTLYPDADAYARHLVEHKVTFSSLEKPLAPDPDCWSEPTGPDVARYYRIFDGKPPIIQPRFYHDEAGERVAIIIPGGLVVSTLVKNVDDSSRDRWPREYAELKAPGSDPARRVLYEGWPVHARAMVEELMATGIL